MIFQDAHNISSIPNKLQIGETPSSTAVQQSKEDDMTVFEQIWIVVHEKIKHPLKISPNVFLGAKVNIRPCLIFKETR